MYKKKIMAAGNCLLLLYIALLLNLSGCGEPPVQNVLVREQNQYLRTNAYVEQQLSAYSGFFPPELPETGTLPKYLYSYQCALLGSPNFVVFLTVQYDSTDDFLLEQARVQEMAETVQSNGTDHFYFLEGDRSVIDSYLHQDGRDGIVYRLAFAHAEQENRTVTFFVAQLWSNQSAEQSVAEYLSKVNTLFQ